MPGLRNTHKRIKWMELNNKDQWHNPEKQSSIFEFLGKKH